MYFMGVQFDEQTVANVHCGHKCSSVKIFMFVSLTTPLRKGRQLNSTENVSYCVGCIASDKEV